MPNRDPRVDAYVAKAPAYAQPILVEARARFHAAIDGLEEDIKWRVPFYSFGGKVVGSTAAFKRHVKVGLWTSAPGTMGLPEFSDVSAVAQLPPAKEFIRRVQQIARSNGAAAMRAPAAKGRTPARTSPAQKPAKKSAKKAPAKQPRATARKRAAK